MSSRVHGWHRGRPLREARYIGKFAIGFNPSITEPVLDILFDEKISGSFHLTPGQAYDEADNQNRSNVHWDLACLWGEAHGGGTPKRWMRSKIAAINSRGTTTSAIWNVTYLE